MPFSYRFNLLRKKYNINSKFSHTDIIKSNDESFVKITDKEISTYTQPPEQKQLYYDNNKQEEEDLKIKSFHDPLDVCHLVIDNIKQFFSTISSWIQTLFNNIMSLFRLDNNT